MIFPKGRLIPRHPSGDRGSYHTASIARGYTGSNPTLPPLPGSVGPLLLAYRGKTDGDIMVTSDDCV